MPDCAAGKGCNEQEEVMEVEEVPQWTQLENVVNMQQEQLYSLENWTYFGITALAVSNIVLWCVWLSKK